VIATKALSVRSNDTKALSPPKYNGETLIAATGFSLNFPDDTNQSNDFFLTPGNPKAYSSVHIIMPPA